MTLPKGPMRGSLMRAPFMREQGALGSMGVGWGRGSPDLNVGGQQLGAGGQRRLRGGSDQPAASLPGRSWQHDCLHPSLLLSLTPHRSSHS